MQQRTSWWSRLMSWWRSDSARQLGHLQFVMYTRRGCHLCAAAWQLLEAAQQRHGFQLQAADIDGDPALTDRYGEQIPVVMVNGRVRFRGTVNQVLLERLLRAEATRQVSHAPDPSTDADDPPLKNY